MQDGLDNIGSLSEEILNEKKVREESEAQIYEALKEIVNRIKQELE